jgi:hypothetical protein
MKALLLLLFVILVGCGHALNPNGSSLAAPGTFVITADPFVLALGCSC